MSRIYYVLSVMVALHVLVSAVYTEHQVGVCRLDFCKCTPAPHPVWTTINCTLPHDQKLDILEGDLPESTTELTVMGGDAVMFAANCLSSLKDINNIRIIGTKILLMRKFTAVNLNVISVYLEVEKCDVLRIEERAFTNIKGPLSVSIKHCEYVSLESEAFSWLLSMSISYVGKLELGQGAFMLDPKAANVDEHGPGLTIEMKNITVPEMPAQTFGSSAASITMQSVDVYAVRQSAFSANTYNIVIAVNCSFHHIEADSFTQKSLIYNLQFYGCRIQQLASSALRSAVSNLNISYSSFGIIETGAINATVASAVILDSEFGIFKERGFVLSSWNTLQMERNSFEDLASHAIVAPGANIQELVFSENEMENLKPKSLEFIGQAQAHYGNIVYKSNYYAQPCHCNITPWIADALGTNSGETYTSESYCTVEEIFARCFNVPEQNMQFQKFLDGVCGEEKTIKCEPFKTKGNSSLTEIKNPRFPHRSKYSESLTDRNKKVIGIIIVTTLGCVIIVMFISLIRWMRRRGHCVKVKNLLLSSNSSCGTFCDRFCLCGANNGLDNARSISRLSVNEYSERHRLNEPRVQDTNHETVLTQPLTEEIIPSEDKTTQTLPEELTKELLENLREKLEDPEHYVEAREMIEHLYELIKVEESCNSNSPAMMNVEENIYELPFQNTTPRIGKNKKQMISIGTRTPSLDKLLPLSPYNRQTALAHEYFEPKDFAVHLYAEIANCEKDKKALMNAMPDIVAEQAVPRGPYLRAVREKVSKPSQASTSSSSTPSGKSLISPIVSPQHVSTIKSNKSTTSNSSGKMLNRPLPEKPAALDPGEGTSFKHG